MEPLHFGARLVTRCSAAICCVSQSQMSTILLRNAAKQNFRDTTVTADGAALLMENSSSDNLRGPITKRSGAQWFILLNHVFSCQFDILQWWVFFFSLVQHNKSDYWLKPWNTTQIPWHVFLMLLLFLFNIMEEKKKHNVPLILHLDSKLTTNLYKCSWWKEFKRGGKLLWG